MNTILVALSSLPLLASLVLGGVEVRRSSLFGFTIGTETLDIGDAAQRLDVHGLDVAADDTAPEPPCSGPCDPESGRPCVACVDEMSREADALIVEIFGDDEEPVTSSPVEAPSEEQGELFAAGPTLAKVAPVALEPVEVAEQLPEAVARLCPACDGGRRRRCMRCEGRCVRLWVGKIEIWCSAPRTEAGKLAGAYALAGLLAEGLDGRPLQGAHALFGVVLGGASPETRERALARWMGVCRRLAESA